MAYRLSELLHGEPYDDTQFIRDALETNHDSAYYFGYLSRYVERRSFSQSTYKILSFSRHPGGTTNTQLANQDEDLLHVEDGWIHIVEGVLHPKIVGVLGNLVRLRPEAFLGHLELEKAGPLNARASFELPTLPSMRQNSMHVRMVALGRLNKARTGNIAQRRKIADLHTEQLEEDILFGNRGSGVTRIRKVNVHTALHFSVEYLTTFVICEHENTWTGIFLLDRGSESDSKVSWLKFGDHDEKDTEILPPVVYNRDGLVKTDFDGGEDSLDKHLYHPLKHIERLDVNGCDRKDPFFLVCGMYKSALVGWVQVLNMIEDDNNRLQEAAPENLGEASEQLRGHIGFLERVAMTLNEYQEAVAQQSSTKYAVESTGDTPDVRKARFVGLRHDIAYLTARCNNLRERCDNTSKLLARFTDVRNAQENMKQTRQMAYLTMLASFVLPWSVIATIFGMNVNEITKDTNMPTIVYPVALAGATAIVGSLFIWRERLIEIFKDILMYIRKLCM